MISKSTYLLFCVCAAGINVALAQTTSVFETAIPQTPENASYLATTSPSDDTTLFQEVEPLQLESTSRQIESFTPAEELTIPTAIATSEPIEAIELAPKAVEDDASEIPVGFGDWLGYNSTSGDSTWVTGSGNSLGIYSLEAYPSLDLDDERSLAIGTGIHFVNGPIVTDLPPRLFDIQMAYNSRRAFDNNVVLDYRVGVGIFTDFEGSARKGVRFPGHIVSYYEWHPWLVSVFGVESLDRDDISVLPVGGVVWRPRNNLIIEAVFPKPKLNLRLNNKYATYITGELGGGTWAIERANFVNDNATYRDLRLMWGIQDFEDGDDSVEFGWAFSRRLEYRSSVGNFSPEDAFIIRCRTHY